MEFGLHLSRNPGLLDRPVADADVAAAITRCSGLLSAEHGAGVSSTGYHLDKYIEEGNIENETHLVANYSLIYVIKISGEITSGRGESTFLGGETQSWGRGGGGGRRGTRLW